MEEIVFSIEYSWLLIKYMLMAYSWVYFWSLDPVPLVYCLFLCHYDTVLITIALQYTLKLGGMMPLALFFSIRITLAILGLLWFHINFRSVFSTSVKNSTEVLIRIALNW